MTSTVSSKLQPYFQTLPGKEAGVEGGGGEGHRESVMEPAIFLGRPGLGWEWVAQIIFKWQLASDPLLGQVLVAGPEV